MPEIEVVESSGAAIGLTCFVTVGPRNDMGSTVTTSKRWGLMLNDFTGRWTIKGSDRDQYKSEWNTQAVNREPASVRVLCAWYEVGCEQHLERQCIVDSIGRGGRALDQ